MLNRNQESAYRAFARLPVVLYIPLSGFLAAGLSGLAAYFVPDHWAIRVWFALTAILASALVLARDRLNRNG